MPSTSRIRIPHRFRVLWRCITLLALGAVALWLFEGTALADDHREVTLRFKHSGKYVDVSGAGLGAGTIAHQWEHNGADNQRLQLIPVFGSEAYYYLRAKHSGLYLDVSGNSQNDGAAIHQWTFTGAHNQQFRFEPTPDGYYKLKARHSNKCVDVSQVSQNNGAQLHQWSCYDTDSQKLTLVHDERFDREFSFAAKHSGKCLDVSGISLDAGAPLHQWTCTGGANQKFRLMLTPDWYYRLVATHSNMCVDMPDAVTLKQQPCSSGLFQKFRLVDTGQGDHYNLRTSISDFGVIDCVGFDNAGQNDGALVLRSNGCGSDDKKFQLFVHENGATRSLQAQTADKYRPRLMIAEEQGCNPLTFTESGSLEGFENHCRASFSGDFAVVANVHDEGVYPGGNDGWRSNSFRVTYGVAFGMQFGEMGLPGLPGTHGYDAQYLVVDVVDGAVTSVWADLHQGYYSRPRGALSMHDGTHVTAWVGMSYNSLKLVDDTTSMCNSDITFHPGLLATCSYGLYGCDCFMDSVLNWGDPVGDFHEKDGKLVMVDQTCSADPNQSYVSTDGITYTVGELAKLRAYMGCDGASHQWGEDNEFGFGKNTFRYKNSYKDPYGLDGCDSGNAADGGDICNATVFKSGQDWLTTDEYRDMYIEPAVAGAADVDYWAGEPFNDIHLIGSVPSSIRIHTGGRVDKVSITDEGGATWVHGGDGGGVQELTGLVEDPIVSVELCGVWHSGKRRVGRIKVTTLDGDTISGGDGDVDCQYIAPLGKRLMGFYGRAGDEVDLLGTIWGNMSLD